MYTVSVWWSVSNSIGTAVGLMKSVISFLLIIGANKAAQKLTGSRHLLSEKEEFSVKKRMNPVTILSQCIIWAVVIILSLSCLLPLLNMVAISFSGSDAVAANEVGLIPKDFNVSTYQKLLGDSQFWRSFLISVGRSSSAP